MLFPLKHHYPVIKAVKEVWYICVDNLCESVFETFSYLRWCMFWIPVRSIYVAAVMEVCLKYWLYDQFTACCNILSFTVGIPNKYFFPFAFGMNTILPILQCMSRSQVHSEVPWETLHLSDLPVLPFLCLFLRFHGLYIPGSMPPSAHLIDTSCT